MSASSSLLPQLSKLVKSRPTLTSGESKVAWDNVVKVSSSIAQAVVNEETSSTSSIIDDIKTWIENTIGGVKTWIQTNVVGVVNSIASSLSTGVNNIIDKVEGVVGDVVDGVQGILSSLGDTIREVIGWITDKLGSIIETLANIGKTIGDIILGALTDVILGLNAIMQEFGRSVASWIGGVVESVRNWIVGAIEGIKTTISNVVNSVSTWITTAYDNVRAWFETTIAHLKETYEGVRKSVEDWIAQALSWLQGVKESLVKWFWTTVSGIATWFKTEVLPRFDDLVKGSQFIWKSIGSVWGAISKGDYKGALDEINKMFTGIGIPAPLQIVHTIFSAIAYFWETIHLQFVGMEVSAQKNAIISLGLESVSLEGVAQAVFKGEATLSDYYNNARLSGISKERAEFIFEASKSLPSPGAVQEAYLRGKINEAEHDRLLSSYGYTSQNIELFKALYWIIPPPQDLIRMSVREVFTPDIARKFGQFEDIPQSYLDWAVKIGLNREWASNYWAAHWDLPSSMQGFEMLHRGVISNEELKMLLRALDVMPFWREKLIQISYNPLTRVDVRRMYKMGILNDEQVVRAYLDLGYNQEKASWLADFTKRYYAPEDETQLDQFHDLARSTYSQAYRKKVISRDEYIAYLSTLKYHPDDVELLVEIDDFSILQADKLFDIDAMRGTLRKLILSAYNDGLIERQEAIASLVDLGYDNDEAQAELSVVDYNRELALRQITVDALHEQFVGFMIDEVGLHEIMGMFNFSGLEIDRLVEGWNVERSYRNKRPSLTDLKTFLKQGLISVEEYLDELRGMGYHERYIGLFQASIEKSRG